MNNLDGRRAQSESIGTILLVAVVVTSATLFGAYYVDAVVGEGANGAADGGAAAADASVHAAVSQSDLSLSHNGGRALAVEDLRVVVRNASGETAYPFAADGIRDGGGADGTFDAGETWRTNWSQTGGAEVTVTLVNDETNTVVLSKTLVVPEDPTSRPSNAAVGESDDDD